MGTCHRGKFCPNAPWTVQGRNWVHGAPPKHCQNGDTFDNATHQPCCLLKWILLSCFLSTHTRGSNFPLPEGGGKKNAQNVPSIPGPDGELFYRILILCQTPFFLTALVQSGCGSLPMCLPVRKQVSWHTRCPSNNERKESGKCSCVHTICIHMPI